MKILLTGSLGMLGIEAALKAESSGFTVIKTDLQVSSGVSSLDVTDLNAVRNKIKEVKPDYVFHLAAETNVDLCQEKPDHAYRVNTIGTENVVLACKEYNAILVYISTSGVFPGTKLDPYTEFDKPGPANVYWDSKFQGELAVQRHLSRFFIVRAGWMVGGWDIDKKFVFKIIQQLKAGKKELMAVSDRFGSPTFTKDFSVNLLTIIKTGRFGIYHLVNKGTCSRYDMAVKIVEFMSLSDKVKVKAVSSDKFPLAAPRVRSEMLSNYKLELLGMNNMPAWEDSLKAYIEENKNK